MSFKGGALKGREIIEECGHMHLSHHRPYLSSHGLYRQARPSHNVMLWSQFFTQIMGSLSPVDTTALQLLHVWLGEHCKRRRQKSFNSQNIRKSAVQQSLLHMAVQTTAASMGLLL